MTTGSIITRGRLGLSTGDIMLFGQEPAHQTFGQTTTTWIVVVMALITTVGTIINSVITYFGKRDERRYSSELVEMKLSLESCEEHRENCETEQEVMNKKIDELQARVLRAETEASKLEAQYRVANRELESLRTEISRMRERLYPETKIEGGTTKAPKGGGK